MPSSSPQQLDRQHSVYGWVSLQEVVATHLVIGGAADAAGAAFRLRVAALSGDQVELLLGLIEAQADALLVEEPQVAAHPGVDEAQLVELPAELADAEAEVAVGFTEILDALTQSLVPLLQRQAHVGKAGVDV